MTNGNASAFAAIADEIRVFGAAIDVELDDYGLATCGSGFENL